MASDQKLDLLRTIPLFSALGKKEIARLGQLMDQIDVPAGRVLMRQGDIGHEMFVIISGKLTVERDGSLVAERGPGSVVGEIALLAEMPRTATVTVVEPAQVFAMGHREFHALMDEMPSVRTSVLEVLAGRLSTLDPQAC
ncbi:MAG: cyclic nucleotide-binding domain-containing protein [Chloroflexota bacterium]|jgi:CRP-like cAMP-binding protein|nr:cyclic nucleotide-binding domain-containing protein [Chloroflexota bacterium]